MTNHSAGSSSHRIRRHRLPSSRLRLRPLVDVTVLVVLTLYTLWSLNLLIEARIVDDQTTLFMLVISTLNILGLWMALRKGSLAYTPIFFFNVIFFSLRRWTKCGSNLIPYTAI